MGACPSHVLHSDALQVRSVGSGQARSCMDVSCLIVFMFISAHVSTNQYGNVNIGTNFTTKSNETLEHTKKRRVFSRQKIKGILIRSHIDTKRAFQQGKGNGLSSNARGPSKQQKPGSHHYYYYYQLLGATDSPLKVITKPRGIDDLDALAEAHHVGALPPLRDGSMLGPFALAGIVLVVRVDQTAQPGTV
jgi:hypothetical protein